MNGITYFRLKSDYDGDITKDGCGLTGQEIDNNFYVLEGRDVKSLEVDGDDITIVLYNGNKITAEDALSGYAKDLSFDFDEESGTLTITQNGQTTTIDGFACGDCCKVFTDSTLVGDGTKENPLGVSTLYQTGHYKPVIRIIQDGEPIPSDPSRGDRYLLKNYVSNYGYLYDYYAVAMIACKLDKANSEWHVPSLDEWNEMLNAVDSVKNHDKKDAKGVFLGKYAGKLLKTATATDENPCGWLPCENDCGDGDCHCGDDCHDAADGCGNNINPCMPIDCHHQQSEPSGVTNETTDITDCKEYNIITPNGWGNDARHIDYFGEQTRFWTADVTNKNAWIKGFSNCSNGVYQDEVPFTNFMSLKLVKDFSTDNYNDCEIIENQVVETIMLPGGKIWTKTNIAIEACPCTDSCDCHQINPKVDDECNELTYNYVIAEWDGQRWVYKVMQEGEIVTTLDDYNDYKLINGELVKNNENVESELEELDERVRILENSVTIIQSDITNLSTDVRTNTENITILQSDLSELESRVETNENNIGTLTNDYNSLLQRVIKAESDITTINGDLTTIKTYLNDYDIEKGTVEQRLSAIEEMLQNDLIDFNDRNADGNKENDVIRVDGKDW